MSELYVGHVLNMDRGRAEFGDELGQDCSLEEARGEEPMLWLGVDRVRCPDVEVLEAALEDVRRLALVRELPEEIERIVAPALDSIGDAPRARMKLGRDHVAELVPVLARWLRSGSIRSRARGGERQQLVEALVGKLERFLATALDVEIFDDQRRGLRRLVERAVREATP